MYKKAIVLILVFAFLAALCAGCGGGTAQEEQPATAETDSADPMTAAEPQPEEPEGGNQPEPETGAQQYPLTDKRVSFSYWLVFPGNLGEYIGSWNDHCINSVYEELLNVSIDYIDVPQGSDTEQFNIMMASQEYPDFFNKFSSYYREGTDSAIEEDIIIPLQDLMAEYAPNYMQKIEASELSGIIEATVTSPQGNVGSFWMLQDNPGIRYGTWVREDWLDELGMQADDIKTYDDWHDMLVAFKTIEGCKSPLIIGGNVIPNENLLIGGYGIAGNWHAGSSGEMQPFYQVDNEVRFGPYSSEYRSFLEMMHQWYEDGIFTSDFVGVNADNVSYTSDMFYRGEGGVVFGTFMTGSMTFKATDPDFKAHYLTDPVIQPGDTIHFDTYCQNFGEESVSISSACADPELAVRFLDFWMTDEGIDLANYGIEGETRAYDENGEACFTEQFLNFENQTVAASLFLEKNFPTFWNNAKLFYSYADCTFQALEHWDDNRDDAYVYPAAIMLNADESSEFGNMYADIISFVQEMTVSYIVGDASLDNYESFYMTTLEEMGIERCIELKQAAYDRFINS